MRAVYIVLLPYSEYQKSSEFAWSSLTILKPCYLLSSTMATVARRFSQAPTPSTDDSVQKAKERGLHSSRHNVHVEFEKFYGTEPKHVDRRFDLSLSDLTYVPKVESPSPL